MKILAPKAILTCNNSNILENHAIVFDEKIIDIGFVENIKSKYPKSEIIYTEDILMPGFINLHTHLEFSKNVNMLEYNGFGKWLDSVMLNREELFKSLNDEVIKSAIKELARGGSTTIGAISSYGIDRDVCKESKIRVIYFSELIGSNESYIDSIYQSFTERVDATIDIEDDKFIPAIAIHSPYSVHKKLLEKVTTKYNNLMVSAHFMESTEEREWIDRNSGYFKLFFEKYMGNSEATCSFDSGVDFLRLIKKFKTSLIVHSLESNMEENNFVENNNIGVISCPVSNRLLTNKKLDLNLNKKISFATDGLSSNLSLNMFSELRETLFVYNEKNIVDFAKYLIISSTKSASKMVNLNSGVIEEGKNADFILIDSENISLNDGIYRDIILYTTRANKSYTLGEENDL